MNFQIFNGGIEMKKVKITVIRKMFNEELAKEYGADGLTACPTVSYTHLTLPTKLEV